LSVNINFHFFGFLSGLLAALPIFNTKMSYCNVDYWANEMLACFLSAYARHNFVFFILLFIPNSLVTLLNLPICMPF